MGQYTDKINAIAEDFATIDYYESVNALEARDGMMIIHYKHGGKEIEFHRDSEYEGTIGKAGDTITLPPNDNTYIALNNSESDWAKNYWSTVLVILLRQLRQHG